MDEHILSYLTTEGFYELYISKIPGTANYKEAYEAAEEEFYSHFKKRRYSSYDSFRRVCYRLFKKPNRRL